MASEKDLHNNHINQPNASTPPTHTEGTGAVPTTSGAVYSRAYMVFAGLVVLAVAIIVKVFVLQFFPDEDSTKLGENFKYKIQPIKAERGRIISSDGSILASSVPEYSIRWDAEANFSKEIFYKSVDSLALCISKLFGDKSKAEYKKIFTEGYNRTSNKRAILIKDHVDFNQLQQFKTFPLARLGQFKSGFVYEAKQRRHHNFKELATRTIGYGREMKEVGLEAAYHSILSGKDGKQLQEKIPGGFWKPVNDDYIDEPQAGSDVITTIDIHLQDVAHNALERELLKHGAAWGCAVLMEVETGYVRAIANLSRNNDGSYSENLNLAISQSVEPGSTIKLISMMAALDDGLIQLTDSIATGSGTMQLEGRTLTDSNLDKGGNGTISAEEAFEKSSNIGTALLLKRAYGNQPQKFLDKINSFGINQPLGLEISGEPAPKLYHQTKEKGWSGVSLTQLSIGYESSFTPLQILSFYNSVANKGKLVRPLFVQEIQRNGRVIEEKEPVVIAKDYCSKETLKKVRQMMEGVMEPGGTAERIFKDSPYKVAGKTGTCKINEGGGYQDGRYRASFVGYFPADEPKYSCIVVIHDPRSGSYYGSTVAAPVFKDLADKIYSTEMEFHSPAVQPDSLIMVSAKVPVSKNGYWKELQTVYKGLGIPTAYSGMGDWAYTQTTADSVNISIREPQTDIVPNVVGMGLQDALYLLENRGMKVQVFGYGTVKRQSVQAGSLIKSNPYITIELL